MNRDDIVELLSKNPDGQTTHEVVDALDEDWNPVQNELRRMRLDGEIKIELSHSRNENSKWVPSDE